MQSNERAGGRDRSLSATHRRTLRLSESERFGVDGPVARAEERRVREQDTRTSEQAWLSDGCATRPEVASRPCCTS